MKFQSYNPFTEEEITKNVWLTLLNKSQHSYFTSWGWISTWINSLPKDMDVQLIAGYLGNEPVIAFFIGRDKRKRHGILPTKIISLNATASRYFDELTIEYNSMVFDRSALLETDSLFHYLKSLDWDEFILPAVSAEFVSDFNLLDTSSHHIHARVEKTINSHFVELQKIRDSGMDYLQLLSANKRSQMRRSIKQYEAEGKIQIRMAEDATEALAMMDQLASLHQQTWQSREKPGSFSNKYFYQFHRSLIQNRFASNEIQLLHVFNGKTTIGYLYNFVYAGNVLFYQSGLNYSVENTHRPGLVSHYFAIMLNAERNMTSYDFLAGDSEYKKSLATNSTPMYWVRLIKSRRRFKFDAGLLKIKENVKVFIRRMGFK